PSGTIGERAVDQNDSLDGRIRRGRSKSGAREESQNQVFHSAAPLMLVTVSVDVAGARNNPPPIAQNVRWVKSGEKPRLSKCCSLYPRKRIKSGHRGMSALCQKRTLVRFGR